MNKENLLTIIRNVFNKTSCNSLKDGILMLTSSVFLLFDHRCDDGSIPRNHLKTADRRSSRHREDVLDLGWPRRSILPELLRNRHKSGDCDRCEPDESWNDIYEQYHLQLQHVFLRVPEASTAGPGFPDQSRRSRRASLGLALWGPVQEGRGTGSV